MSVRRALVAIIGDGRCVGGSAPWEAAEALGRGAVERGYRVLTGGLGGVMEAACRGARGARGYREGDTIGILPGSDPDAANDFVDVVIPSGLGHARNGLVASAPAVIAVGGGAGTLSELSFAWISGRLVIALDLPGASGTLAGAVLGGPRPARPSDDRVFAAASVDEALTLLNARYADYTARGE